MIIFLSQFSKFSNHLFLKIGLEKNQGGRKRWPKNQRGEQSEPSTSRPTEKEQEPQVYQREQQPIQQQQKPPTSVWKDKRERPPGPTQPTTQSQSSGGKFPDDKSL